MNSIAIQEVNSEVHIIVFLDKNHPTKLAALREAAKMLQREVLYYEAHNSESFSR